jgi:hypothetical protein
VAVLVVHGSSGQEVEEVGGRGVRSVDWDGRRFDVGISRDEVTNSYEVTAAPGETNDDARLWSARALRHYAVEGDHRELGRLADLLVEPYGWSIRYLVVEAGRAIRANRFLVGSTRVRWIIWNARRIAVRLAGDTNGAVVSHGA